MRIARCGCVGLVSRRSPFLSVCRDFAVAWETMLSISYLSVICTKRRSTAGWPRREKIGKKTSRLRAYNETDGIVVSACRAFRPIRPLPSAPLGCISILHHRRAWTGPKNRIESTPLLARYIPSQLPSSPTPHLVSFCLSLHAPPPLFVSFSLRLLHAPSLGARASPPVIRSYPLCWWGFRRDDRNQSNRRVQ